MYRTLDIQKYEPQSFFTKADLGKDCWNWNGSMYANGYGKIGKAGYMAHRVAYELTKGSVPEDMALDHLCRNRKCINPDHLEIVTLVENVMRGESQHAKNAKKTHCINGHEFNEANTYKRRDRNTRECIACRNVTNSRYLENKKEI